MSTNNRNLLKVALKMLPKQNFFYLKYLGCEVNSFGVAVPRYAEPLLVNGCIQAVDASLYQELNLNMDKNYRLVFSSLDFRGNESQEQPDRFFYDNKYWEIIKLSPWFEFNGWNSALIVEVKELQND